MMPGISNTLPTERYKLYSTPIFHYKYRICSIKPIFYFCRWFDQIMTMNHWRYMHLFLMQLILGPAINGREEYAGTLHNDSIYGFTSTKILKLNDRKISKIDQYAFNCLQHLTELYLSHNYIVSLPGRVFQRLVNLQILDLGCKYNMLIVILPMHWDDALKRHHLL